jgi:hypothetical protein
MNAHNVQECYTYGKPLTHDPTSGAVCRPALHASPRCRAVPAVLSALTRCACGRKPFPVQTVSAVLGTPCQATARHRRHSRGSGLAVAVVRLATRSGCGAPGDVQTVAAPRVPPVLAQDTVFWTAPDPDSVTRAHPTDGTRQSHLGSAAHRQ